MSLGKKLIYCETKEQFNKLNTAGEFLSSSVVFIKSTGELWTHGNFFGGSFSGATVDKINILLGGKQYDVSLSTHTHDSRYVNVTGDTMTGALKFNLPIALDPNVKPGDGFKLLRNSAGTGNYPSEYTNVASFVTSYVGFQLASYGGGGQAFYFRKLQDNSVWHPWHRVLHTGDYTDTLDARYVKKSGDVMTGSLTTPNLVISNTDAVKHIEFKRGSFNYITTPVNGSIAFVTNGKDLNGATPDLIVSNGAVRPGTTKYTNLGIDSYRWAGVYANGGNFSTNVYAGTYIKAGTEITVGSGWFRNSITGRGLYNEEGDARWFYNGTSWYADKPITSTGTITGTQLVSNIASGTAPLKVASNTVVTNLNADKLDGVHLSEMYIPSGDLSGITGTVAAKKAELITYFNKYGTGIGANAKVSTSLIDKWGNDTATLYASSAYSVIKIGGGYPGTAHTQFMLSTLGSERIGVVGRSNNAWTPLKWLAFTTDNVASATKLLTARTINGTSFDGSANITTTYWGAARTISAGGDTTGSIATNGGANVTIPITVNVATKLRSNRTNYKGVTDGNVVGLLMWKHYGNNHTIFDASSGTTPSGTNCDHINSKNRWSERHPTLMGFNGTDTFGVRVDTAYRAERLQTTRTLWGQSFDGTKNVSGALSGVTRIASTAANIEIMYNNDATKAVVLNSESFKPFEDANRKLLLGTQTARWSAVFAFDGNFTGALYANSLESSTSVKAKNGYLISTFSGKTISIGSANASYCHYDTSASSHYFSQMVTVNGALNPYLNTHNLGNSSRRWNLYAVGGDFTGNLSINTKLQIKNNGKIVPHSTATRRSGMYGVYDAAKIGHIWSMGEAYVIPDDGANFGNLYGIAYKYASNTTGGTMAGGHQMVWVENGTPGAALGTYVWSLNGFIKNGSTDAYALTGSGGHMMISDAATSSSIVKRTASGYIHANYIHTNISDEAVTVASVFVGNSADKYLRKISYAAFVKNIGNSVDRITVSEDGDWNDIKSATAPLRLRAYDVYSTNSGTAGPTTYGNVLEITGIAGHWQPQLWFDGGTTGTVRYRNKTSNSNVWGKWQQLARITDTVAAANKVTSSLTLSAGAFAAKSFNGSAAVTVSIPTHTGHLTNNSGFITASATTAASNRLAVKDIRDTIPLPNSVTAKSFSTWFNNKDLPISSMGWASGFTILGWDSTYQAWQLAAGATNTDHEYLYFRRGRGATWSKWEKVLTESSYSDIISGSYVKKTGDTLSGTLIFNVFTDPVIKVMSGTVNKSAYGWRSDHGTYIYNYPSAKYIGIKDNGTPHYSGNILLHAGNYNTYAPTKTGVGASGSWGISVTGNAASATKLQTARTIAISGGATGTATSFNGSANISIPVTSIDPSKSRYVNGSNLLIKKFVGIFYGNGDVTGIIKLTTPTTWSDAMSIIELDVSEYNGNGITKILISGYNYTTGTSWRNANVSILGNSNIRVRLAHDGTKCCILLGSVTTKWNHPKVVIRNVTSTYAGYLSYDGAWSTSLITAETGITNVTEPVPNLSMTVQTARNCAALTTSRKINGTLFNGSADITTATWGTARTLSVGTDCSGSVSVNGGSNFTIPITVNTATKLRTARTIWGQSFNGTNNISGDLTVYKIKGATGILLEGTSITLNPTGGSVQLTDTEFSPSFSSDRLIDLGRTNARWGHIYGLNGDFIGNIQATGNLYIDGTAHISGETVIDSNFVARGTIGGQYYLSYTRPNIVDTDMAAVLRTNGSFSLESSYTVAKNTIQPILTWSNTISETDWKTRFLIGSYRGANNDHGQMRFYVGNSNAGITASWFAVNYDGSIESSAEYIQTTYGYKAGADTIFDTDGVAVGNVYLTANGLAVENAFYGEESGYPAISGGDEILITGSSTMHVNYRSRTGSTTPNIWNWKAGSSSSWANFNLGSLKANGVITATGVITSNSTITATGAMTASLFKCGSSTYGAQGIELYGVAPVIDFHYNSSTADYTHRIVPYNTKILDILSSTRVGVNGSMISTTDKTSGCLIVGDTNTNNVAIDQNEIQSRYNGSMADIWINGFGGNVNIGAASSITKLLGELEVHKNIVLPYSGTSWLTTVSINGVLTGARQADGASAQALIRLKSFSGNTLVYGGYKDNIGFYGYKASQTSNSPYYTTVWDTATGTLIHSGAIRAVDSLISNYSVQAPVMNASDYIVGKSIVMGTSATGDGALYYHLKTSGQWKPAISSDSSGNLNFGNTEYHTTIHGKSVVIGTHNNSGMVQMNNSGYIDFYSINHFNYTSFFLDKVYMTVPVGTTGTILSVTSPGSYASNRAIRCECGGDGYAIEAVGKCISSYPWVHSSDRTLKYNISTLADNTDLLDKADKISLVSFNWKANGKADFGAIAQDVRMYFPEIVSEVSGKLSMAYTQLLVLKTAALERRIKQLEERLIKVEGIGTPANLEERIALIESRLGPVTMKY